MGRMFTAIGLLILISAHFTVAQYTFLCFSDYICAGELLGRVSRPEECCLPPGRIVDDHGQTGLGGQALVIEGGEICHLCGSECSQPVNQKLTAEHEGQVEEYGTLLLHCQYSGLSTPSTVSWLKRVQDEVQSVLTASQRVNVSYTVDLSYCFELSVEFINSTLQISKVIPSDSGSYICKASSGDFISSIEYNITVTSVDNCIGSPCGNDIECIDFSNGYECNCKTNTTGRNCMDSVDSDPRAPNIIAHPQDMITLLAQPVNLTCEANGNPPPVYRWYQDGVQIPGANLPYLYIPEISPGNRGNYSCRAINQEGSVESSPGLLTIRDMYQFTAWIPSSENINKIIVEMVGTTAENIDIYSIKTLSGDPSNAALLITVSSSNSTDVISKALAQNFNINPAQITRYDGCPAQKAALLNISGTEETLPFYSWPETEIGAPILTQPCPNQPGTNPNSNVTRYCGGSYTSGAMWSEVDFSQCIVWVATTLNDVTSQPQMLTSETISDVVEIIDTHLTMEATVNPVVAEEYLDIIDNIQQANSTVIQQSEEQTGASTRIIESLGRFQDEVMHFLNSTNGSQVFTRERFAIQVRDVDANSFSGEVFSVDLGSFEEALILNTFIPEEAIQITMDTLSNVTASIAIPPNLITDFQQEANQSMESQRLSYSVFLTDILFQSPNQTAQNLSIETVIIAVRLRELMFHETLPAFINASLSFSTSEVAEKTNSSNCVHWEASEKFGEWSSEGCREIASEGEEVICECSIPHRSSVHFAVLFDLNPSITSPSVGIALQVITYIGLAISISSLVFMIITYLYSKDLRNSCHGQILLNMSFSLLGLYILFLIAGHATSVTGLCGLVSALLHYFILVFFSWTSAEAVFLYIKLVKVLGIAEYEDGFAWKAGLITWTAPAVVVIVSMAGYQYYPSRYFCRPTQWPFFFGLVLPFTVMYIFNWVMFFIVITSIYGHTRRQASLNADNHSIKDRFLEFKRKLISAVCLSLVFGLGWGLGLLATSSSVEGITITFQVIFSLFVGSQGLLLLVFHGFRSPKVREVWMRWFNVITMSYRHKKAYVASSSCNPTTQSAGHYVPPSALSTVSNNMTTPSRDDSSVCMQTLSDT